MTDTNERLRALILAALMVLSVFAGTVALSGSAAANHSSTADDDNAVHLSSGGTYWQGQSLWIDANGLQTTQDIVQVRRVTDDNEVGGLVSEIVVHDPGANDNATINSDDLDGDYIIVANNRVLDFTGNNGVAVSGPTVSQVNNQASPNASDYSFEVAVQTLSASFDDDTLPADTGGTSTIEMTSNRGSYVVNITAEGLDEDDLGTVFNASGTPNNFVPGTDSDGDDDDIVQVRTTSSGDIVANFTQIDAGSYTFNIEVNDTTASASASVDVAAEDVNLNFAQGIITQQEGDIATITITMQDTDEGWLWVGDPGVNYLERMHVVDDNGDGVVVVVMNTRWAGTTASARVANNLAALGPTNDNSSANNPYYGYDVAPVDPYDEDTVENIVRFNGSDSNLNQLTNDIQSAPFDNQQPLEPADYSLTLSSSNDPPTADTNGDLVINDEEDVATLDLTERSTDGISTFVAPTGDASKIDEDDDEDVAELLDSLTPSSTLAVGQQTGDKLIVQVNASGLSGYLFDGDGTLTGLSSTAFDALNGTTTAPTSAVAGSPFDGLYLNITSSVGNNRQSNRIPLEGKDARIIDGDGVPDDTFLVVLDSRDFSGSPFRDGQRYTVSFQVGQDETSGVAENAYVDADEQERVETEISIEDSEADFDNMVDEELQVTQNANATVSGTSNVAPGEEIAVRLRRTGDGPFLMSQTVEVGSGGSWSATFDTSQVPIDTTFTATVREGGNAISDTVDGVIVQQATPTPTPTTEPPETTTAPPETTTAPPETTTAPPETTMEPTETESPGQPGFGVAIAIVALLGAALLALRRRD